MRRVLKTQSLYMPSSEAKNNHLNSEQRTFKAREGLLMEPINLHPRSIDIKQLTLGGGFPVFHCAATVLHAIFLRAPRS